MTKAGRAWVEGEGQLATLVGLRDALGGGDLRSLYLAWLVDVQRGYIDEEEEEPSVPAGLAELDGPHVAFAAFMAVDADLLAVAAETSALLKSAPRRDAVLRWLASQSSADKDRWLLEVIEGEGAQLRWELGRRIVEASNTRVERAPAPRTAGELIARAATILEERERREELERAERWRRAAEAQAAARRRHLDGLVGREELWREVDVQIAARLPRAYDRAVE